ncbi:FAD-binding domain-containing protein [Testicularia cyperi]|uniref:FAD-binding domain-containing protein n=1 Tax=Testicularia cyperi TaxID=1882483 RepID=A0A317XJ99_9BASI|nr:FAD-binding domain-containing protein [Testicularia cyperi]
MSSSGDAYTQSQYGGWNPLNNKLQPSCIVQPATTEDVSKAMKAIFRNKSNYAVRSGGHTGMDGWDSVQGGVLIDFAKMTDFSYDARSKSVSLQPGLRWGDVYNQSAAHGVAPMGGRVYHVGTGLLLGGGLSNLSPQQGYACDGIMSADVVLVDGSVRKGITAKSHPDLMRAIKGGGGRFGIVTKYQLRAYDTGTDAEKRWWGGTLLFTLPDSIDQYVKVTERFIAKKDDPKASMLANVGMLKLETGPTYIGTGFHFYEGNALQFTEAYKDFLAIPGAIPQFGPLSYLDVTKTTPLGWSNTQAYKWLGGSLYPKDADTSSSTLPTSFYDAWVHIKEFIQNNEDSLQSAFFSITPVKTTQIEKGYENGANAISPPRGKSYMHWLLSAILNPGTTSFPAKLDEERLALLTKIPSDQGLPLFLNEVDATQPAIKSYGWYNELKKAYAKYDPTGFSLKYQKGPEL